MLIAWSAHSGSAGLSIIGRDFPEETCSTYMCTEFQNRTKRIRHPDQPMRRQTGQYGQRSCHGIEYNAQKPMLTCTQVNCDKRGSSVNMSQAKHPDRGSLDVCRCTGGVPSCMFHCDLGCVTVFAARHTLLHSWRSGYQIASAPKTCSDPDHSQGYVILLP